LETALEGAMDDLDLDEEISDNEEEEDGEIF